MLGVKWSSLCFPALSNNTQDSERFHKETSITSKRESETFMEKLISLGMLFVPILGVGTDMESRCYDTDLR